MVLNHGQMALGAFGLLALFGPVVSILTLYLAWRGVRALEGIAAALRDQGGPRP